MKNTAHGNSAGENERRHRVVSEVIAAGGTIMDAICSLGCNESAARVWLRDNGYGTTLRHASKLPAFKEAFRSISSCEAAAAGLGYDVLTRLWGGVHRQTAYAWVKAHHPDLHKELCRKDACPFDDAPTSPGIYVFSWNGEDVYVGQASNLRRRLKEHYNGSSNSTDLGILLRYALQSVSVRWLHAPRHLLNLFESEMIRAKSPRFNGGRGGSPIRPSELSEIAASSVHAAKRK